MGSNDVEKISIVIDAENNATDEINHVGDSLRNMQNNVTHFNYALRQYNNAMSGINNTIKKIVKEAGSAVYDFTSDAISNFSELSEQHAKTLGAMANNYDNTLESQRKFIENSEKMKQQAIDLAKYGAYYGTDKYTGQGSLYSPTQVSEAQTELVKAGVSEDAILNTNVLSDILQFAQANQLGTEQSVEFATALGSQFNISYENWGEMLDKVSHAADLSVVDVADVVQSMKYAGGITSGLGRSIDETLAEIAILGNFGLKGSQGGSGIQAFLTRLLTGDTTVITDAQREVAPPKALKAFYEFSNYAKSSGSEITYNDILNESFTKKDITGELRPMSEIIDTLSDVMDSLNDEEQAWFAKKLFGLYQMKAAYALVNGDKNGEMGLEDVIKNIREDSEGTNANKLAELLNSQNGQIESLAMLWDTTKTELGMMLEPTTLAVLTEAKNYLQDPGHYQINWENIQTALDESCDAIEESYGSAIADAVKNIGNLTIDLGQVIEEIAPDLGDGLAQVLSDLANGDILGEDGVFSDWNKMIESMRGSLDDLPDDLKDLGNGIVSVIDMFEKLATINMATKIAQLVMSTMQIALMTIRAANVIINGASVSGGGAGGSGGSGGGGGLEDDVVLTEDAANGKSTKKSIKKTDKSKSNKNGSNTSADESDIILNDNTSAKTESKGTKGSKSSKIKDKVKSKGSKVISKTKGVLLDTGGIASSIAGGYAGSKLGSSIAEGFMEDSDLDTNTQGLIDAGASTAGGIAGSIWAKKAYDWAVRGGLSKVGGSVASLIKKSSLLEDFIASGLNSSLGLAGESALTGTMVGALGGMLAIAPFGAYSLYKMGKDNHKKNDNLEALINTDGAGLLNTMIDQNGNVIKNNDGSAMTADDWAKARTKYLKDNEYKYRSGDTYSFGAVAPKKTWKNLWGLTGGYKSALEEYNKQKEEYKKKEKANEDQFYTVQENYYKSTGNMLKWGDYSNQKDYYDQNYSESINNLSTSINTLSDNINILINQNSNTSNYASKIPGFNTYSKEGQEKLIENYLTNEVTLTPQFRMDAPQVKVDVKVDSNGNIKNQTTSILNPGFNDTLNSWYQKTTSQNGSNNRLSLIGIK